jgi:hypothetical protein
MEIDRSITVALRLLRSFEVGIGDRTQPEFFGDSTDNIFKEIGGGSAIQDTRGR